MEETHKVCPKCSEKREVIGPETLVSELGEKFLEDFSSADWSKRKEALEKLQRAIHTNQLSKDGDYRPLLSQLRKVILTDLCVIVVGMAVQCVTCLAKRLGKHFAKYAEGMCQIMFEKFVEKRQRMTELLREAVDTIFETTRLESLQNTLIKLLKHQNPSIRYEVILFLARSFPKSNRRVLSKPQFQPLFLSLKGLLGDGDIVIREKTLAALGAAVQAAGEKALMPYIRDLDLASKAKIEVYQMRAWEVAKTYNEMKFPNFREKTKQPNVVECPLSLSTSSQVTISFKEQESKLDDVDSTSNRSMNALLLNGWPSESEKQCLEIPTKQKDISTQISNTPPLTDNCNNGSTNSKDIKKEILLRAEGLLNANGNTDPVLLAKPKYSLASTHSNIDVKAGQSSNADKMQLEDLEALEELRKEIMIREYTDQCRADVISHLKEYHLEHRLITYNVPATEIINEIQDRETEAIGNVLADHEKDTDESQVGFTKSELDELLHILNSAKCRARTKENVKINPRAKKHNRCTTMSRGILGTADHKETQCSSAVSLVDKPTQTLFCKEPNSISCIVNCCEKCTRILMATAPRNSKYLFPVSTSLKNPLQSLEESSDNTVYRELVSSDRMHAKSESDLIKNTLELVSNQSELDLKSSFGIKNFLALHHQDVDNIPHKFPEKLIEKLRMRSNAQQTEPERKLSLKSRDKRVSSKKGKVSTCNKTTFVTTTSQRKKKKRKKNRSAYASLDDVTPENRKEWFKTELGKAESKRAMKVRVIRIE